MHEKEYIEREAVIELAKSNKAVCSCLADIVDVMQIVNDIPTADVQSVKHGHWVWESNYRDYDGDICSVYSCSVCSVHSDDTTNFCPNCGAKMVRKV